MQSRLDAFRALGAEVIAISFVEPPRLREYLTSRPWPFRVLADPERRAYQAFGLGRAKWSQLLRPRVIRRYLRLILDGQLPRPAQEDVHQLGGDFVLDSSGRVIYAHRGTDPSDRPAVSELLRAVQETLSGKS